MKKIVWMACGMALMCAPLSASANVRYDDPQEKVQKKEVPNPEKAAQRRTDEMDKALNLTEKQYKKIYKLFLKEEKEKVEAMMQRHPGGMNGLPPMAGRPPMGGSSGREGAALQLGGSLGNLFGNAIHLDEKDKKIAIMCGMSAVFSALFGTPVAAAIFPLEVISIGVLYYAALVPCIFSSFIGVGIARYLGIAGEHFTVLSIPAISVSSVGWIIFLSALCAGVSIVFCLMLHGAEHTYRKIFPNPYVRILAASAIFILLTLLIGTRDYCGSSMPLIERSMEGEIGYEAFFLKMLFTAIALGAGFKGGEIVPTLCVGAAFGCAFGQITGFAPSLCAACSMAALFAGVTNCPISSLVIALELFGYEGMEYFSIAIAVAFALSGYYGLYASQKFVYSKTKTEFINRKSNK